jgi:hypothetical protein
MKRKIKAKATGTKAHRDSNRKGTAI